MIPARPTAARALAALFSGALAALAFSPFDWPLFAWLSPALLYLLLHQQPPRTAVQLGWFYGCGFFGAGVHWVHVSIHVYGGAPWLLATLLTLAFVMALALLFAAQAWLFARLRWRTNSAWLGFAALWWLFEWLRSWLFTGFPWLYLGYAALDLPIRALATLTGVWGVSLLIVLLASAGAESVRRRHWLPGAPLLLLTLLSALLPSQWTQPSDHAPLKVALVQPNISQHDKWEDGYLARILRHQVALSLPYSDHDLIVWPETAIPSLYYQAAPHLAHFLEHLDQRGTTLISGFPYFKNHPHHPDRYQFHNSLGIFSHGNGTYHKQRLVPFGEYVPFENQLRGLIEFFDLPMSEFSLPETTELTLNAGGHRLAPLICYEIAYPELTRHSAHLADIILTVSNDAWFDDSIAADQHLQIARMRALENGRWLIRGTNDGLTAVVAPDGSLVAVAEQHVSTVLSAEVPGMEGTTPYQLLGIWPSLLLTWLLLAASLKWLRVAHKDHP